MSVKLPIISIKKDPTQEYERLKNDYQQQFEEEAHLNNSEVKQSKEHFYKVDQIPSEKSPAFQQEQLPNKLQDNQIVKPIQTVISLKKNHKKNDKNQQHLNVSVKEMVLIEKKENIQVNQKDPQKEREKINELKNKYQLKSKMAEEIKRIIIEKKKEIKQIGEKLDKDLNKSIIKASKIASHNINIRDIFSAPPQSSNARINQSNEQLKRTRLNIKKIKDEIVSFSNSINNPICQFNHERGIELHAKLKETEAEVRNIQKQKQFLAIQIQRNGKDINISEDQSRQQQYLKQKVILAQITSTQKQQKSKLYKLEKEDILLMQKIKYMQQRQNYLLLRQNKSATMEIRDRSKIDQEIKELIKQINQTLEQRNRVQNQKRGQFKSLNGEVSGYQATNLEVYSKLREHQAFILHYYDKKSRKKAAQKIQKSQKSSFTKLDNIEDKFQTPPQTKTKTDKKQIIIKVKINANTNDKNSSHSALNSTSKETDIILVEKKKTYEFGSFDKCSENQIILSDEFLGNKNLLTKLTIHADQHYLYSIQGEYRSNFTQQQQIKGYHLGSKKKPTETPCIQIDLSPESHQVINFVQVGFNKSSNLIQYLQMITSEGREIKWGVNHGLLRTEQKNIRKYQYMFLKAKVGFVQEIGGFGILGVGFSTIYLGVK